MNIEHAWKYYEEIKHTELKSLYQDLLRAAIRYAHIRAEWKLQDTDKRLEVDEARARAHNVFIDCCNILARNQEKLGEVINWRETLGNDRKIIGDFACYLSLILALETR